jgi:uncharacterized delta-60 repeat protein
MADPQHPGKQLGYTRTDINHGSDDLVGAMTLQGKQAVVAGVSMDANFNFSVVVARYRIDGTLDNSFGTLGNGISSTTLPAFFAAEATGVAIDGNGNIVVVGDLDFQSIFIERLRANGSPDPSFNGGQPVVQVLPQPNLFLNNTAGLVIESGGKIDVAETVTNSATSNHDFAVTQFDSTGNFTSYGNGSLYGGGGTAVADFGTFGDANAAGIALTPGGQAVVTGTVGSVSTTGISSVGLARFTISGIPDGGFGTMTPPNGETVFGTTDSANALTIGSNGMILVAGATTQTPSGPAAGGSDFLLLRFSANGSRDHSFGPMGFDGVVTANFNDPNPTNGANSDTATSVKYDLAGRIVVGGQSQQNTNPPINGFNQPISLALVRYTANGVLDTSFGTGGEVLTVFQSLQDIRTVSLGIASDDKIVVATSIATILDQSGGGPATTPHDFLVARYLSDNSPSIAQGGGASDILPPPSSGRTDSAGASGVSGTVASLSGDRAGDGQATPLALDQLFASLVGQTSAKSDPGDADGRLFDPFSV